MSILPSQYRQQAIVAGNAVRRKDAQTVEALLEEGLDPNLKINSQHSTKRAVTIAVEYDDPRIFDLYVRHGANLNMNVVGRNNPLFLSAANGDLRGVLRCLGAGADADTRDSGSKSNEHVLHLGVTQANPQLVKYLLDGGAWKAIERGSGGKQSPLKLAELKAGNHPQKQEVLALLRRYQAMPCPDFEAGFSKAELLQKNDEGLCMLDHPQTWRRWSEVCETLAARGEAFNKQELTQPDAQGQTWLQRATECFSLKQVVRELNKHNEAVTQDDLLDARQANPLCESIRETRQIPAVITSANTKHWSVQGLQHVVGKFDAYEREMFVPNLHQLAYAISTHRQQQGEENMGRA